MKRARTRRRKLARKKYREQQQNPDGQKQYVLDSQPEQCACRAQQSEGRQHQQQDVPVDALSVEHNEDKNDDDVVKLSEDLDIAIRHSFIRKVFAIVAVQCALMALVALPFYLHRDVLLYLIGKDRLKALTVISSALSTALLCRVSRRREACRKYPKSYIVLFMFTLFMGCMDGFASLKHSPVSLISTYAMAAGMTIGMIAFAMQTKIDFSGKGPYLFVVLVASTLFGFFVHFAHGELPHKLTAAFMALLFSVYLVYDTKRIVGRIDTFGIDEYPFAALTLYLDIANFFFNLLQLCGVS